jgi:ribonucleoside-diphosphate reductase alpha chain
MEKGVAAASGGSTEPAGTQTTSARLSAPVSAIAGLEYERFFTREGIDPFDEIEWEMRSAVIGNEKGAVVFEQRDVEIPRFWSQQATNIVVSKYFRGVIGTPER